MLPARKGWLMGDLGGREVPRSVTCLWDFSVTRSDDSVRERVEAEPLWITVAIHLTTRINWYTKLVYVFLYKHEDPEYFPDVDEMLHSDSDDEDFESDWEDEPNLNEDDASDQQIDDSTYVDQLSVECDDMVDDYPGIDAVEAQSSDAEQSDNQSTNQTDNQSTDESDDEFCSQGIDYKWKTALPDALRRIILSSPAFDVCPRKFTRQGVSFYLSFGYVEKTEDGCPH